MNAKMIMIYNKTETNCYYGTHDFTLLVLVTQRTMCGRRKWKDSLIQVSLSVSSLVPWPDLVWTSLVYLVRMLVIQVCRVETGNTKGKTLY